MSTLKKWIGTACFVAACFTAFGKGDEIKTAKKTGKDSTAAGIESMGFKNLFVSNQYNPSAGYAGQVNPLAVVFVNDYISRHGKELSNMKLWAQPYFTMMDNILVSYGIPREMKYLAVIESHMQSWALSWAGAVGPWQFMPETGRRMGLRINNFMDERTNYYRSTHAAAKYLKELYGQLGDWLLVIAAYNGGPGRVFNAIKRSGSRDFWKLQQYLPEESRNHVKKFIGTHFAMEGSGGETTSTADEWASIQAQTKLAEMAAISAEELDSLASSPLEGRYQSLVVANQLSMDIAHFNRLNPGFDKNVMAVGGCTLRLPKDKMEQFQANKYIILRQSLMASLESAGNIGAGFPEPKARPAKSH